MLANIGINSTEFRAAFLRSCIADAYISLMLRINGEAVYIEDGERIELTPDRVAMNILYHIEAPRINEFGREEGIVWRVTFWSECCHPVTWLKIFAFPHLVFLSYVKCTGTLFSVRQMERYLPVSALPLRESGRYCYESSVCICGFEGSKRALATHPFRVRD